MLHIFYMINMPCHRVKESQPQQRRIERETKINKYRLIKTKYVIPFQSAYWNNVVSFNARFDLTAALKTLPVNWCYIFYTHTHTHSRVHIQILCIESIQTPFFRITFNLRKHYHLVVVCMTKRIHSFGVNYEKLLFSFNFRYVVIWCAHTSHHHHHIASM